MYLFYTRTHAYSYNMLLLVISLLSLVIRSYSFSSYRNVYNGPKNTQILKRNTQLQMLSFDSVLPTVISLSAVAFVTAFHEAGINQTCSVMN